MARIRAKANATLKDVARVAGVSTATVSRALMQPQVVRPETRKRIQKAISKLNYVADGAARALSTRRTHTIGAVIPTLDNAIYSASTHSLQRTLEQAGYTLLLACHEFDLAAEARITQAFAERGVDGLVMVGMQHHPATLKLLATLDTPYVFTWAVDRKRRSASVGFDNRAAGRMIARHLLALGHRNIGMISGVVAGNDRAADRLIGVRTALAAAGVSLPASNVIEARYSLEAGGEALKVLMSRARISAVICGNDVLAIGAIQAAQALGVRVPQNLSVTGFDDMAFATVISPALTTIRFPIAEVGIQAARYLIERIGDAAPIRTVTLPLELVVRDSTARPAPKR